MIYLTDSVSDPVELCSFLILLILVKKKRIAEVVCILTQQTQSWTPVLTFHKNNVWFEVSSLCFSYYYHHYYLKQEY